MKHLKYESTAGLMHAEENKQDKKKKFEVLIKVSKVGVANFYSDFNYFRYIYICLNYSFVALVNCVNDLCLKNKKKSYNGTVYLGYNECIKYCKCKCLNQIYN